MEGVWYKSNVMQREPGKKLEVRGKTFKRCRLSHTKFSGIVFRNCAFEQCLMIGCTFAACEFHRCSFVTTNTYKITIKESYIDPLSFRECLDKRRHQNIGTQLFQELLRNSRDQDQIEFERDAMFLFLRWKRYQDWYELGQKIENLTGGFSRRVGLLVEIIRSFISCLLKWVWEIISGSGLRVKRLVASATIAAVSLSVVNFQFREELGLENAGKPITDYLDALYFTVVSLTTLGYGDITPGTSIGQILAILQSIVGFFLFAMLASVFFRRLFP